MVFFEKSITVSLTKETQDRIYICVMRDRDTFPSRSDFVRIAVMKLLREVEAQQKGFKK
jgi:Arc/MetJ-type ribon-helix-helix transcriptional regulator